MQQVQNFIFLVFLCCLSEIASGIETHYQPPAPLPAPAEVPSTLYETPNNQNYDPNQNYGQPQHQEQGYNYQHQSSEPSVPVNSYNENNNNNYYGWPEVHQAESTPEPIKYNYYIIPDQKEKEPEHHHHHHHEGWGWGWGWRPKSKKPKKKDGIEFFASILGIKALKLGIPIFLTKLAVLILILRIISRTGTVLAPESLAFLALPIAFLAFLLFIPLLIFSFFIFVVTEGFHKGNKEMEHGHGSGWGWSRRKGVKNRYARNIKEEFIQDKIITILSNLPDLHLDHFKKNFDSIFK